MGKDLETMALMERLEELGTRRLRGTLMINSLLAKDPSSRRGYIHAAPLPRAGVLRRGKMSARHNNAHSSI